MPALEIDDLVEFVGEWSPDFVRTISRDLTHKRLIENVYVTSMYRATERKFLCGAYLPHANTYLNNMKFHASDVMLKIVEIGRQIGTAVCHEFMGVGQNSAFILNDVFMETLPGWLETDWSVHDSLISQLTVTRCDYGRDGQLRSIRADAVNQVGGRAVCRGYSDWSIQSVERYRRMRDIARSKYLRHTGAAEEDGIPRDSIRISSRSPLKGSVLNDDLWIRGNGRTFIATLKVDQTNRFFFDHPNDHVPGMLMFEGMRQLALDVAGRLSREGEATPRITEVAVGFGSFAELDHSVEIAAHLLEADPELNARSFRMRLEARQMGKPVTEAFVTIE